MNIRQIERELELIQNAIMQVTTHFLPKDNAKHPNTFKEAANELLNAHEHLSMVKALIERLK